MYLEDGELEEEEINENDLMNNPLQNSFETERDNKEKNIA
jgi:hypothetical protein